MERFSLDLVLAGLEAGVEAGASEAAEVRRSLTAAQLELIYQAGLFKLFVPVGLGGLAMDLPDAVRLEERLALIDGSLGWTITLCAGASWFVGFMEQDLAQRLFADPKACLGGSGLATGTAEQTPDGYLVNGDWQYATGAPHNTAFTANCRILQNGQTVMGPYGQPLIRAFVFYRDEVQIIDDWHTMGLKATASHAFRVRDLFVDAQRAFDLVPEAVRLGHPCYRFPFVSFAEVTLAANYLGMFRRFFFLCPETESLPVEIQLLTAHFYDVLDLSWEQLLSEGTIPDPVLYDLSRSSRLLVKQGLAAVSKEFPRTGMQGAMLGTPLNRVWRDIHTASQHAVFRSARPFG